MRGGALAGLFGLLGLLAMSACKDQPPPPDPHSLSAMAAEGPPRTADCRSFDKLDVASLATLARGAAHGRVRSGMAHDRGETLRPDAGVPRLAGAARSVRREGCPRPAATRRLLMRRSTSCSACSARVTCTPRHRLRARIASARAGLRRFRSRCAGCRSRRAPSRCVQWSSTRPSIRIRAGCHAERSSPRSMVSPSKRSRARPRRRSDPGSSDAPPSWRSRPHERSVRC